jgi:hypothetical protein
MSEKAISILAIVFLLTLTMAAVSIVFAIGGLIDHAIYSILLAIFGMKLVDLLLKP